MRPVVSITIQLESIEYNWVAVTHYYPVEGADFLSRKWIHFVHCFILSGQHTHTHNMRKRKTTEWATRSAGEKEKNRPSVFSVRLWSLPFLPVLSRYFVHLYWLSLLAQSHPASSFTRHASYNRWCNWHILTPIAGLIFTFTSRKSKVIHIMLLLLFFLYRATVSDCVYMVK